MDTWSRRPSPLYESSIIHEGEVMLPIGRASRVVRAPEQPGSRLYGYGFSRTRNVGFMTEQLCYILSIVVPPDSPIDEAQADLIAASFRFR